MSRQPFVQKRILTVNEIQDALVLLHDVLKEQFRLF